MALLRADPFAFYTAAQASRAWSVSLGTGSLDIGAYGPSGANGVRFTGDLAAAIEHAGLAPSGSTAIIGVRFRFSAAPGSRNRFLQVREGSTFHCNLDLNTDRTLAVYSDTTLIKNLSYTCAVDTFIDVWFKVDVGNSGSWEVRVYENSSSTPAFTDSGSADTQNGGTGAWDTLGLGAACAGTTDFANAIFLDGSGTRLNDILGPADVYALYADARATPTLNDFTLSAGTDVAALLDDTTADDDTTYVHSSTINHQQSVFVDLPPASDRTILGMQTYLCAREGSGAPYIAPLAKQDGTIYLGTAVEQGASYVYTMKAYSAMPDGAAITYTAFNAIEWGAKLTTSGDPVRLSQLGVAVLMARNATSQRNLLTGFQHTVAGSDVLISGRSNAVDADNAQTHGENGTNTGDRSVLFNLDGTTRTVSEPDTFSIYGTLKVNGTTLAGTGSVVGDLLDVQFVRKTSDETVTSSTTFQDDDHLTLAIGASEIWVIQAHLFYDAATTGDLKTAFSLPTGATGISGSHRPEVNIAATIGSGNWNVQTDFTTPGASIAGGVGSGTRLYKLDTLVVDNGVNAGNVTLRWAQNSSDGTGTVMRANSCLIAQRFA
jgi:hypothetical protein